MKDKIKELRLLIPVPMGEALTLLKENDGDVKKCFEIFKSNSIHQICEMTSCDEGMANEYYVAEKYDFNRAISLIKEAIYDKNYEPIEGLTLENLRLANSWLTFMREEGFDRAIEYNQLGEIIDTFGRIPSLQEYAKLLEEAKEAKDHVFEGYKETDSLEEFVRRNAQLDDVPAFQEAIQLFPLSITTIEVDLKRHIRNMIQK